MIRHRPARPLHWAAWASCVALVVATGAIHTWIALDYLALGLVRTGGPFLAMAAGYGVGAILLVWRGVDPVVLALGAVYVAALLLLWAAVGARDGLALLDKALEVVLLGLLLGLLVKRPR